MTTADGVAYPAHWEADVVLRDGSTMHIRPIRPSDAQALQAFHQNQSPQSTYFRFFAAMDRLSERDLARFTQVDHNQRVALVLVQRAQGREAIAAVGRFDRFEEEGDVAEIAFNVADAAQGRGLGSILLEHLAAAGRELGIRRFHADVLPSNTRMLRVFTDAGYDAQQSYADGVVEVSVPIRPTDRSLAVLAERERRAEALSMRALLAADGVLVHYVGEEGQVLGEQVLTAIRASGFSGEIVTSTCTTDLDDSSDPLPTLAVLAAPTDEVTVALPLIAARGVRAVVLLTAGFTTAGADGRTSQRTLVRMLREHGLRLVGPRSFGVIAHGNAGRLDASLATSPPVAGDVGVFCQSSSAARGLLHHASSRRVGVSSFVAAGLRADISGNDTIQYWTTDERTKVATLFLESIGNPRKFSRVARRLSAAKPVVVAIAGTTGQQRVPGHGVRSSTAPRRVLPQLMRQAGVLLASSARQLLDWAMVLSAQPLPADDRVLVISNSGSQVAVLGDLLTEHGLHMERSIATTPTVSAQAFHEAVTGAAADEAWDMAIVAYGPYGVDESVAACAAAAQLSATSGRTVVALVLGRTGLHPELVASRDGLPVRVPGFEEGSDAVKALAAARTHARRAQDHAGHLVEPADLQRRKALKLLTAELSGVPQGTSIRLSPERATELLATYGLTIWPATRVDNLEGALAAAASIGWPVALKASDDLLRHRSDLGGVRLDLSSVAELTEAYTAVNERLTNLGRANVTVEVQRMAATGASCVLTAVEDELYGPIVSFGMAGDAVELLDDVAYRVPPLTDRDVSELVRAVRASHRLLGHRGLPALDVTALEDVIARVSVLKDELPQVRAVELNPVLVSETGVAILSATVDLAPAERGDLARRTLP